MNSGEFSIGQQIASISTPVLVVGRGPVGMTVALRLAGFGIKCTIVDPEGWEPIPGSKALCMQRESMEILEQVSCGRAMADGGVTWPLGRTFYRGKEVAQICFQPYTGLGFPPFVNFAQRETERLLIDRLRSESRVRKLLQHRLISIDQDASGVDAIVDGPEGVVRCRADYVIGCDGSRSTVRKELGVAFTGKSYATNFLIFDIRANLPFPNERRLHFNASFNPGRTVLIHPLPNADWHIDWQVGPEPLDVEEERRSGRADNRIRSMLGDLPYKILWLTTYAFRSLIADRMRVGRVFIVGDAAHLVSPYGARGLNSGLADAENLAWKLAFFMTGRASASLLDSYHAERHGAAAENLRITDKTAQFMAPPSKLKEMKRKLVLTASVRFPAFRKFVDAGIFYQPAVYKESGVVYRGQDNKVSAPGLCGVVAPDSACTIVGSADGEPDRTVRLRDLMGGGFLALIVAPISFSLAAADRCALAEWPENLPACCVAKVAPAWPRVAGDDQLAGVMRLADFSGTIANEYVAAGGEGPATAILIRPDSYVAARWHFDGLAALKQWISFAVGRSPAPSGGIL